MNMQHWIDKAKKGKKPYGECFYKGFHIATAITPDLESPPSESVVNHGFFWIKSKNTFERIRGNKLPLKMIINNSFAQWDRSSDNIILKDELLLPNQESYITERFHINSEGMEKISTRLFSNNHFATSQFICRNKKIEPMKTVKLFLASSNELVDDRKEFELSISRHNDSLIDKNIYIKLIIWENFIEAMSKEGLQNEYNKAATQSDIFIMLFFTKVGKFTLEEFEAVFGEFKDKGRPIIFTYIKNAQVSTGSLDENFNSVLAFKKRLTELNHYVSVYTDINDLKNKFRSQLDKLFAEKMI